MTSAPTTAVSSSGRVLALGCGALPGLFLLITSTTHLVEGQFVYDVKRLLQLCLMLALFLAAGLHPALRGAFAVQFARIPAWVKALLGLIIVLGIISSATAATSGMHLAYSLLEVALLTMLVLAVLVIAACRAVTGETFDQVAITLLAMTAIAVGIQELVGVAAVLESNLAFHSHISLMHYSFPRFYNQVQGWTLPVIAALPLVWSRSRLNLLRRGRIQSVVCLMALALHWYVILMSGGRGVAVGLAVSFAVCLVIFPATRKPSLRSHLPGLVLGGLLFFTIAQVHEQILGAGASEPQRPIDPAQLIAPGEAPGTPPVRESENEFSERSLVGRLNLNSTGRWRLWRHSIEDIGTHPVLGIGPMNYACSGSAIRAAHPHNFLLQFAGEWGIPATTALLVIVAYLAVAVFWAARRGDVTHFPAPLMAFLITGSLAAVGHSLFSGVMVMPASQVAGIFIGGWLMGLTPLPPRRSANRLRFPTLVLIAGIAVATLITAFSFNESGHREYREVLMPAIDHGIPRYWQQGKLCKYFGAFPAGGQTTDVNVL